MASSNARGGGDEGIDRTWRILLIIGAVAGFLFLGMQTADYFADAKHPALQKNDLISALASVALLVLVGVIAARRAQVQRQAAPAASSRSARATIKAKAKTKAPSAKRAASPARRKRRA